MELAAHASNWSNALITKTPEGSAYKYKEVVCKETCEIVENKKYVYMYDPDHPDANAHGFVEYPDISKDIERDAITNNARTIEALSRVCAKDINLVDHRRSFKVEYKVGDVKLDIFNFNRKFKVVSWVREDKSGHSQIINF